MSAVAGRSRMDVLLDSQHRRQRILNFLNGIAKAAAADPDGTTPSSASVPQITAATGDKHKLVIGTLELMRGRHEVASTGARSAVRYVALVTTTVSAQEMYDAISSARATRMEAEDDAHANQPSASAGGVHKSGAHPIKNQGGQGALRRTAYVNCYQHY